MDPAIQALSRGVYSSFIRLNSFLMGDPPIAYEGPTCLVSPTIRLYNDIYGFPVLIWGAIATQVVGFVIYFWPAVQDKKTGKEVTI